MSIDSAHVRSGDAENGMLHSNSGTVLCLLHDLLNRRDGFIEIDNDAFARAFRFAEAVTAIAQAILCDFGNQNTGLGAAYVNGGQKISLRHRHGYGVPCPFAMAGLGFCKTTKVLALLDAPAAGAFGALALTTLWAAGLTTICFAGVHFLRQCDFGAGLSAAFTAGLLTSFSAAGSPSTASRTTNAAGFTPADIAA